MIEIITVTVEDAGNFVSQDAFLIPSVPKSAKRTVANDVRDAAVKVAEDFFAAKVWEADSSIDEEEMDDLLSDGQWNQTDGQFRTVTLMWPEMHE